MHAVVRLCERPGCSDRADVAYGFDPQHLLVWLDALRVGEPTRSGVLCRRHANAMVVPIGWMLDDRREAEPRLFQAPVLAADAVPPKRRRSSRTQAAEQLQFDVGVVAEPCPSEVAAVVAVPVPAPVADEPTDRRDDRADHEVAPWMPHFDQSDDLQGLLKARGRLLSRAFNGRDGSGE